jgi:hypothetical protein
MAEGGFAVCVALVAKQKPGNPLKRSVELSQILICLMRGRSTSPPHSIVPRLPYFAHLLRTIAELRKN